MRFYDYIRESLGTVENNELFNKIVEQGNWLHESKEDGGLGLQADIDELLERYSKPLLPGEIMKFMRGLNELRSANLITKGQHGFYSNLIKNVKNIKENGKWCILNKVNTNVHVLAFLIVHLIDEMKKDKVEAFRLHGVRITTKILKSPKEGLIEIEGVFLKLVRRYFPTIDTDYTDFKNFVEPIIGDTTEIGERYEDAVETYLSNRGFEIRYKGGNGDFIDMWFGTDLLVYHPDYGFKRVQVKPLNFSNYTKKYVKKGVEWLAKTNTTVVEIFDMETLEPIEIKNN